MYNKRRLVIGKVFLHLCAWATLLLMANCTKSNEAVPVVRHYGALKQIMHQNDLAPKAALTDFKSTKNFYALGALEQLKGEILVLHSHAFIAQQQDGQLEVNNSFDHKATLLVTAQVASWASFPVPDDVVSYKDLENFISKTAKGHGLDPNRPFPFLLEGIVASADWHVVNWKAGDKEHSHQKHINSGLKGSIKDREVDILGFYSEKHKAIFTHHSTFMHLHIKTKDDRIVGHLDDLTLSKKMTLKLPLSF